MDFKKKLLYIRASLNLSQTQLAKELNVAFETINRWESGKIAPSKRALMKFDIFCKNNKIDFKDIEKE